jgi:hypothetical protein
MYNQSILHDFIEFGLKSGRLKKPPIILSRVQIDGYVSHFKSIFQLDDEMNTVQIRPYTSEEIAWIQQERFLCRHSFHHFLKYCYIKNEEDRVVGFEPRIPQLIFLDIIASLELEQIAVLLQVLKARQLGLSRITSLIILHRLLFYPHVNSVIASSTPDKTRLLAEMLEFVLDRIPPFLIPTITARRDAAKTQGMGEWLEFGGMDTGLTLQHGSQYSGIARGTTPTVVHLSELCEFLDPEELVDSSLLRAMHDSAKTFLVLESTALGRGNWWHQKWLSAKVGWPERRSRLCPVFLPWFTGTALYPKEVWLKARPVPENHIFPPFVEDHAARAREYVQSDHLLSRHLGNNWVMSREQKWFYEVERSEAIREGRLNKFFQEMPANDSEAFQSSNISVFSTEIVTAHRDQTRSPLGVYGLLGPSDLMPARVTPHRTLIDPNKKPVDILYNWGNGYPINFTLVPLHWSGYNTDSGLDKIYLYELPDPDEQYGIGFDTADGIGKDRTCAEGIRKGTPWRKAGQTFEYTTDRLNALDSTPFVMAMAALFSQTYDGSLRKQCRVAIECKGNGDQTQNRMRLNGWTNFHPWMRIDNKKLDRSQFHKIGVFTNTWFRTGLMEFLTKMIRDMEIDICSPFMVDEMESLEGNEFQQSLKAAHGEHDDRLMALGFIIISMYQWEANRPGAVIPSQPKNRDDLVKRYAICPANPQSSIGSL